MLDSDNVLIRCPNGHELQTAKADMQKKLACPICNTVFTPADAHASPDAPAGTMADPHVLDLAAGRLGQPVTYPAYTKWMLAAWIIATVVQAGSGVWEQIKSPELGGQLQNPTAAVGTVGLGCAILVILVAAVVMQLMWVYRIHADAHRGGQYDGASPGLALGLSFIPAFNFAWTAWLMWRLARFAASAPAQASGGASEEPTETPATRATRATTINLVFGVLLSCSCLVGIVNAAIAVVKNIMLASSQGGQMASVELQRQAAENAQLPPTWTVISLVIGVVGVCIYAWSVRKMEKALYPCLGALEP